MGTVFIQYISSVHVIVGVRYVFPTRLCPKKHQMALFYVDYRLFLGSRNLVRYVKRRIKRYIFLVDKIYERGSSHMQSFVWLVGCVGTAIHIYSLGAYDNDNGDNGRGGDDEKKAETSTDSAPPPCKADVQQQQQQQQHKASLRRVVTSADMKAEDEDQATPRTLTPG